MTRHNSDQSIQRVGFVSTRISGTDGVSLEIGKWTEILERMGYECVFIAGVCDRDPDKTFIIEEADFKHPRIEEINAACFGSTTRNRQMSDLIRSMARSIKDRLYEACENFQLDMLIVENALTIPMNIPLGVALAELLLETQINCIIHHHDFVWERERYLVNAVEDYISSIFPPRFDHMHHVVINSVAGAEFSRRTGMAYRIIPNVMNFDQPPAPKDDYLRDFRKTIGVRDDDILILQPTRIVQRKGIEHSIELVRRLNDPRCKLVITHSKDDEGLEYGKRIRRFAELLEVDLIFAHKWIKHCRCLRDDGCKCFSVWDAYREADLVTYPSTYEGFGNAFLESVYYKKPLLCNRYTIFRTDIEPFGFRGITMDGFITDETVEHARKVLDDSEYRQQMVDQNYEVAKRYFSFRRAETELHSILAVPRSPAGSPLSNNP